MRSPQYFLDRCDTVRAASMVTPAPQPADDGGRACRYRTTRRAGRPSTGDHDEETVRDVPPLARPARLAMKQGRDRIEIEQPRAG